MRVSHVVTTAFSQFLSDLYETTGHVPLGISCPPEIFDRLVAELGPRCVFVSGPTSAVGNLRPECEMLRLHTDAGPVHVQRSSPIHFEGFMPATDTTGETK